MGRRPGIDGRELILAAAFKLFSEQGIDGVSIRAVNREAGLGPASVHYHFGTKDALLDAVVNSYGDAVIDSLKARAQSIVAAEAPVTARDVVMMLADPYLELMATHKQQGHAWMRIISSLAQTQPDRVLDRSSTRLTWAAASHVYPEASPATVQRAMRMCSTLLTTQLALETGSRKSARLDLEMLIDFLSAGLDSALRAPSLSASRSPRAS